MAAASDPSSEELQHANPTNNASITATTTHDRRRASLPHHRPPQFSTPPQRLLFSSLVLAIVALLFALFYQHRQLSSSAVCSVSSLDHNSNPPPALPTVSSANKMSTTEQTFIAIKPDGVQRGLVGPIITRFEQRGYKLVAMKLVSPSKAHLEQHYADLKDKPFFPGLIQYMLSGPIVATVWEGLDAVKTGRALLGATNPLNSQPGTIRGDYAIQTGRNVIHGSDSVENAKKEIALWFGKEDLISYKAAQHDWVYE